MIFFHRRRGIAASSFAANSSNIALLLMFLACICNRAKGDICCGSVDTDGGCGPPYRKDSLECDDFVECQVVDQGLCTDELPAPSTTTVVPPPTIMPSAKTTQPARNDTDGEFRQSVERSVCEVCQSDVIAADGLPNPAIDILAGQSNLGIGAIMNDVQQIANDYEVAYMAGLETIDCSQVQGTSERDCVLEINKQKQQIEDYTKLLASQVEVLGFLKCIDENVASANVEDTCTFDDSKSNNTSISKRKLDSSIFNDLERRKLNEFDDLKSWMQGLEDCVTNEEPGKYPTKAIRGEKQRIPPPHTLIR